MKAEHWRGGWVLALATIIVTLARAPHVLIDGRMWAEEAVRFFTDLRGTDFLSATTYIYNGTVQVLTNWSVWLSTLVPLPYAALVTTWLGMAILLVLAVQWGQWTRSQAIAPLPALLVFIAFLLLPNSYEEIATATNQQWICSLSVLLLALYPPSLLAQAFPLVAMWAALCGLTGVPSCMLAPAFLVRGVMERSWRHAALGLILTGTTALQAYLIIHYPPAGRAFAPDLLIASIALVTQTIIAPISLAKIASGVGHAALDWGIAGRVFAALVVGAVAAGLALLIRMARSGGTPWLQLIILGATWIGVTMLNQFGALGDLRMMVGPPGGSRYFLLGCFCFLILLSWASRDPLRQRLTQLLLGVGQRLVSNWVPMFVTGPSWHDQASRCEMAPSRPCAIQVWPWDGTGQGWWVHLPPSEKPTQT
jgi:hypothetical protein